MRVADLVVNALTVEQLLAVLDADERPVICERFGLDGGSGDSLQEISDRMNMPKKTITATEERAIQRTRAVVAG